MADESEHYELLDFGAGRKLERFGAVVLDRPSPAAEDFAKLQPKLWREATARYERTQGDKGVWRPHGAVPDHWKVSFDTSAITFQLQVSPFGHIGVFPEQHENWEWIARRVGKAQVTLGRPLKVLNLFAYTGGSTIAAASAGAKVVHIDAARNIVDRARANAALSGLADRPIRWITEDAAKFCRREFKRGNRYDAVILDPPTYGHGPNGESWNIADDLLPLLALCGELTAENRMLIVVTCHTPGIGPAELAAYLAEGFFGNCAASPASGEMLLKTSDGRKLPSGVYVRWPGDET
jgi:23S rRNA (cytosine1962-C5)-methyltransferase